MKYCVKAYDGKTEYLTKSKFFKMFLDQSIITPPITKKEMDTIERNLYIGRKYTGTSHMFWVEEYNPSETGVTGKRKEK
jgi:hypothetical protein